MGARSKLNCASLINMDLEVETWQCSFCIDIIFLSETNFHGVEITSYALIAYLGRVWIHESSNALDNKYCFSSDREGLKSHLNLCDYML